MTIKYWVNDTTGSPVVPRIDYGGCVTNAGGTCVPSGRERDRLGGAFPACGPDAQHQANWEITVKTTDASTIAAGFTWSNLQTGLNLASYAPFSPGSGTWYSACGTGQPFHTDTHYSVYVKGELRQQPRHHAARLPRPARVAADHHVQHAPDISADRAAREGQEADRRAQHSVAQLRGRCSRRSTRPPIRRAPATASG